MTKLIRRLQKGGLSIYRPTKGDTPEDEYRTDENLRKRVESKIPQALIYDNPEEFFKKENIFDYDNKSTRVTYGQDEKGKYLSYFKRGQNFIPFTTPTKHLYDRIYYDDKDRLISRPENIKKYREAHQSGAITSYNDKHGGQGFEYNDLKKLKSREPLSYDNKINERDWLKNWFGSEGAKKRYGAGYEEFKGKVDKNLDTVHIAEGLDGPIYGNLGSYHTFQHSLINNIEDPLTETHELTHASRAEYFDRNKELLNSITPLKRDTYYTSHSEVYARVMALRRELNLDPNAVITKKDLINMPKDNELLEYYGEEGVLKLLNTLASKNSEQIPLAKKGGSLISRLQTGGIAEQKYFKLKKEMDSKELDDQAFKEKYKSSKHEYKYENDPIYKNMLIQNQQARKQAGVQSSIDMPSTDVRSKLYQGNPNLKFIPGNSQGESRGNIENSFLSATTLSAPILPLKALKLGASKNLINKTPQVSYRNKPGQNSLSKNIPVDDKEFTNLIEQSVDSYYDRKIANPEFKKRLEALGYDPKDYDISEKLMSKLEIKAVSEEPDRYGSLLKNTLSNLNSVKAFKDVGKNLLPRLPNATLKVNSQSDDLIEAAKNYPDLYRGTLNETVWHEMDHLMQSSHGIEDALSKEIIPRLNKEYQKPNLRLASKYARENNVNIEKALEAVDYKVDPMEIHSRIGEIRSHMPDDVYMHISKDMEDDLYSASEIADLPKYLSKENLRYLFNKLPALAPIVGAAAASKENKK